MPDDIDLSTEALLAHREKAEKATPGPWEVLAPDAIYISAPERNEILFENPQEIGTTLSPEEQRANAAHIAANSPDVVKAHIDEILRLRNELAAMKCRVCEGNIPAMRTCEELLNLSDRIETYNREFMRLESAAHWLVHNVREGCPPLPPEYLPDCDNEGHPHNCASCWVEAALKITDGEFQNNGYPPPGK